MRFTSPSRRALGLVAASAIGMSTAVLGVTGIASAETGDGPVLADVTAGAVSGAFVVPADVCAVRFLAVGGAGDPAGYQTGAAGLVTTTVLVHPGDSFTLSAGDASTGAGVDGEDSSITGPGGFSVVAQGGSGTGAVRPANVVSSAATSVEADNADNTTTAGSDFEGGPGGALAVGVLCPEQPDPFYATGGPQQVQLVFSEPRDDADEPLDDDLTYEVSRDGTAWTTLAVTSTDPTIRQVSGTVGGLTNGTSYSFRVRTVSAIGTSDATAPATATPYQPIGAPEGVTVTRSASAVTVAWSAPSTAGTYSLAGYSVGYSGGESGDEACRLDAATRTCTFALPAGHDYLITVFALDSGSNSGVPAQVQSGIVPGPAIPSTVPTKDDGDITGPAGAISKLSAGQKVTLQGSGYAPNSTVQLLVYSSPVSLGTVVTDSTGSFSVEVTVPANLANGTHHLVATGIDAAGNVRNLVITVTVSGGVATLATTGFDTVPVALGGGLTLLAGAGLVLGARRRKA